MYNVRGRDLEQLYLLPENIKDWVPENDFSLIIVDLVSVLDLTSLFHQYREDGQGAAFYHPEIMTAIVLYTYFRGIRSSRQIEQFCRYDVGYRVVSRNTMPDHTTISRFFKNNGSFLGGLFFQVLALLNEADLLKNMILALDGTKIKANASLGANMSYEKIEKEIYRINEEILANDSKEDAQYGEENSYVTIPNELATHKERMKRFLAAKERLQIKQLEKSQAKEEQINERMKEETETGKKKRGRRPKKVCKVPDDQSLANTTDPDSSIMKYGSGFLQGYNAQAIANQEGFIITPLVSNSPVDYKLLQPSLTKLKEIAQVTGIITDNSLLLTDAGYWSYENYLFMQDEPVAFLCSTCHEQNVVNIEGNDRNLLIIDEISKNRFIDNYCIPLLASAGDWCKRNLFTDDLNMTPAAIAKGIMKTKMEPYSAKKIYSRRKVIIEPVFGWIKENRGIRKFRRRGRINCQDEWNLICLTQNLRTVMTRGLSLKLKETILQRKKHNKYELGIEMNCFHLYSLTKAISDFINHCV